MRASGCSIRPIGTYRVLFPGAKAAWLPSGHIVFYRTGRYHAVPFDLSSGTVTGESFSVLDDAQELDPAGDWSQTVAITATGALAYLAGSLRPAKPAHVDRRQRHVHAARVCAAAVRQRQAVARRPAAATASLEAGRLLIRAASISSEAQKRCRRSTA